MAKIKLLTAIFILAQICVFPITAIAQQVYPVDHPNWKYDSEQVSVGSVAGRQALMIRSGFANLEGVTLKDGEIEFEIYPSGDRAFVYLYFRGQSKQEYEAFYLRPHNSKAPDAIQYAPAFQGRSAWQLYHGEAGTTSVEIPAMQWTKIRVKLAGQRAEFWVGNGASPSMVINDLGHEASAGFLAFRSFIPRNSDAEFGAYFSGLKITANDEKVAQTETPKLPETQVTQWRVSPAFTSEPGPIIDLPPGLNTDNWTTPLIQKNGTVEFLRSRQIPEGSRHWSVAADVTLWAEQAVSCAISFGFSDELTLLANGKPVVYQDHSYRYADRSQLGLMHPDQLIAYVPLRKGENLLRAIVSDRFGGWGLSARLTDCPGVSLTKG